MAEIITKDSEEFKELTGWIKKAGKALENASAQIRPGIAGEHYLQERTCARNCMYPNVPPDIKG